MQLWGTQQMLKTTLCAPMVGSVGRVRYIALTIFDRGQREHHHMGSTASLFPNVLVGPFEVYDLRAIKVVWEGQSASRALSGMKIRNPFRGHDCSWPVLYVFSRVV